MKKLKILQELLNTSFEFSTNFQIDSRLVEKGDIFFAIRNGNNYVQDVIDKGAFPIYDAGQYSTGIKVDDTVLFMQELASKYREKLNSIVIGITGSNGKTSVKDIVATLLDNSYKTQGNYNNHIGLPLTILNTPYDTKYLVLEMGMNKKGEIRELSKLAKPDYSIITNIGTSHLEFLETLDNVLIEKSSIIEFTKNKTIVNGNDKYLQTLDNVLKPIPKNVKIDDYGTSFEYNNKKI